MLDWVLTASFFMGCALAAQINSVNFRDLSIDSIGSQSFPHKMWELSFEFAIENVGQISESDYFLLELPHVYRVKFSNDADYQFVTMTDGSKAFKCYASQQAAYKYESSVLRCDALRTFSSFASLQGNLSIGVVFSNGGSSYEFELENAQYFKSGQQLVEFSEKLSAVANFARTPDFDSYYYEGRTTTYGSMESYYLGLSCPDGYILGGTQVIDYSPGTQPNGLDCSDAQVQLSSDFNDWFFPETYQSFPGDYVCNGATLSISFDKIDSGQRIWVNNLQSLDASVSTIYHSIHFDYTCTNTLSSSVYTTAVHQSPAFVIKDGVFTGSAVVDGLTNPGISTTTTTTTTTWPSTYATTTTGSVSSGATIVTVHVDIPGTSSIKTLSSFYTDSSEPVLASTPPGFSKPTTSTLTVTSCISERCSKSELMLSSVSPSVSTTPSSVSTTPSSVSTTPSSVSTTPSSVSTTPSSVSTTPSSVSTTPSSVSTTPSSVSTTPSSVSTTPSSVSTTSSSVSTTSSSVSTTSSSVSTTSSSVSTTSSSVSTTSSSVSTTSSSVSTTSSSVSTTSSSVSTTSSSVSTTSSSVSTTSSSVSTTSSSVSTTSSSVSTTPSMPTASITTPITTFLNRTTATYSTGRSSTLASSSGFSSSAKGSQSSLETVSFTRFSSSVSSSELSSLIVTSSAVTPMPPASSLSGPSSCLETACFKTVSLLRPLDSSTLSHSASASPVVTKTPTDHTGLKSQTSSSSTLSSKISSSEISSSDGITDTTLSSDKSTVTDWARSASPTTSFESLVASTASLVDKSLITTPSLSTGTTKSSETPTESVVFLAKSSLVGQTGPSDLSTKPSNTFLGSVAASSFPSISGSAITTTKAFLQTTSTPLLVSSSTAEIPSSSFAIYEGLAAVHKFRATLAAMASMILYSFT